MYLLLKDQKLTWTSQCLQWCIINLDKYVQLAQYTYTVLPLRVQERICMTRKYCEQTELSNTYAQQIFNYNSTVFNVSAEKGTKIFLNALICDIYLYLPEHMLWVIHVFKIPVHILFCIRWYSPLSSYLYSPLEELDGTVMFFL
jgi:hypothetical protein